MTTVRSCRGSKSSSASGDHRAASGRVGSIHAIVPVKSLREAKSRLAGSLSTAQRRRLVLVMLADVLAALRAVPSITAIHVVTPDATVAKLAARAGAAVIAEPADTREDGAEAALDGADGLNAALRVAITAIGIERGDTVLIVPADVPLVTCDEIASLLAVCGEEPASGCVIAADLEGRGTNALLISPPDLFAPSFGVSSLDRHVAAARAAGVEALVQSPPGLARDIDEPADLDALRDRSGYTWLQQQDQTRS